MSRRAWLLCGAGIALLALAFVVPALPGTGFVLGGEDLFYFRPPFTSARPGDLAAPSNAMLADAIEVFHPDLRWMVEQVHAGHLPLWNPDVGAGWPQLAAQQTAPLFPTNLVAFVLPFWDSLGLVAALKIALTAGGTLLFAQRVLGLGAAPAALAATAFAAGAYPIDWLEHPHSNVYALLPLLLLTVDAVARRPQRGPVAALGAVLGLALLGGHPQSLVVLSVLVVPWALWRLSGPARRALGSTAAPARVLVALAAGAALGVAAAAVVLLPLLEFVGASTTTSRGGLGGVDGKALISLALPEYWGRPDAFGVDPGPENYLERTVYVGVPALLIAVGGLVCRRSAPQWFFAIMALVGALVAVQLPLVTDLVDTVPPFSLAAMIRALVIPAFCLAMLAGIGLQRLMEAPAAERRRAVLAAAAVACLPPLYVIATRSVGHALGDGLGALPFVPGEPATLDAATAGAAIRWCVLAAVVIVLLACLWRRAAAATAVVAVLLATQAVDLVELSRGIHPVVDDAVTELAPTAPLAAAQRAQGSARTVGDDDYLLPNEGLGFHLRDLRARGQPTIGRIDQLFLSYTGTLPRRFDVDGPRAGDVLDAFGVGQVLTGDRAADPADGELAPVLGVPGDILYRNTGALPRAYFAADWRSVPDQPNAIWFAVHSSTAQLRSAPVIEGPPPARAAPPSTAGEVRFVRDDAARVTLEVEAAAAGRLVLLDAHYPGWHATVNGEDAAIAPANGAFRSVVVPAGTSVVEFRYRPLSVYVGAGVSLAAWCTLFLLGFTARRRRRSVS